MLGTNAGGNVPARVAIEPTLLKMLEEGIQQCIRPAVGPVLPAVVVERFARGLVHMRPRQKIGNPD